MKSFKQFVLEYHKTPEVLIPSHETITKPEHPNYGSVGDEGHTVHHTGKHTYVFDKHGKTVLHIGHKKTKGAPEGRLALSNVTKGDGDNISAGKVLHHLIKKGHTLESDEMNTPSAHAMLMKFSKHSDIHTHIEDNNREVVKHRGDISSVTNQKKYSATYEEPHFWDVNKHKLVFKGK